MISQKSTTKDVKLFGYDFRGHTRGTLVIGIAYGYPYCKGSATFSLVYFKYHKWKIVYSLQTLCLCASPQGLSSSAKSLVQLGNNFVREAEGCRWELKARYSAVQLCASSLLLLIQPLDFMLYKILPVLNILMTVNSLFLLKAALFSIYLLLKSLYQNF